MTAEIRPGSRRFPVVRGWVLGVLERLLQNTKGADFELAALIRRVKDDKVTWLGPLPCRDWTADARRFSPLRVAAQISPRRPRRAHALK